MENHTEMLKTYGPWGLVLLVLMKLLSGAKVTFEYPYEPKVSPTNTSSGRFVNDETSGVSQSVIINGSQIFQSSRELNRDPSSVQ